jgi:hypothetical protein
MSVLFRGATIVGVHKGTDTYTGEALAIAREIHEQYGSRVYRAEIDRFDGLILYWTDEYDYAGGEEPRGWHFVTPICGYTGSGPIATAEILEMFGFGQKNELLEQINFGDNQAYFTFSKQPSSAA